jgi:hypothetical protein
VTLPPPPSFVTSACDLFGEKRSDFQENLSSIYCYNKFKIKTPEQTPKKYSFSYIKIENCA